MSPTNNTLPLIPPGTQEDVISYYITCIGENPYGTYLEGAYNATYDLNRTLNVLLDTTCPNNQDLLNIQNNLTDVVYNLDNITLSSACPPFQQQADIVLNTAICDDFFKGTFLIWVSQYVVSGSIFILLVVSSIIYYYFGRYWNMDKDDLDNMVARLVENDGGNSGNVTGTNGGGESQGRLNEQYGSNCGTNGGVATSSFSSAAYAPEATVPTAVEYGNVAHNPNPLITPMATVVVTNDSETVQSQSQSDAHDVENGGDESSQHSEIGMSPMGSRTNTINSNE